MADCIEKNKNTSTAALLLAAGFGTRLKPLTQYCPKPILPVAGVEALFLATQQVVSAGIKKVIINTHYKASMLRKFIDFLKVKFPEVEFFESYEEEILGTGGSIFKVLDDFSGLFTEGASLYVQNADTICSFSPRVLLNKGLSSFAVSLNEVYLKRYKPLWFHKESLCWGGLGMPPTPKTGQSAHFLGRHLLDHQSIDFIKNSLMPESNEFSSLFESIYLPLRKESFCIEATHSDHSEDMFFYDLTDLDCFIELQSRLLNDHKEYFNQFLEKRYSIV